MLVRPTEDNARRVLAALDHFGFPAPALTPMELVTPDTLIQMGVEPVQIHVMTDISGVTWDEVWSGHVVGHAGDHDVRFIGRREFLKNKRVAARPKDLADIDALSEGPES